MYRKWELLEPGKFLIFGTRQEVKRVMYRLEDDFGYNNYSKLDERDMLERRLAEIAMHDYYNTARYNRTWCGVGAARLESYVAARVSIYDKTVKYITQSQVEFITRMGGLVDYDPRGFARYNKEWRM